MSELHESVSRMAAGLILFYEANTRGDVRMVADRFATEVIDLIRADERGRVHVTSTGLSGRTDYAQVRSEVEPLIRADERADLRAKVEALHTTGSVSQPRLYINRDQVLALLDGAAMSDHDPQCRYEEDDGGPLEWCDCDLIRKVRADERERQEDGWAARLNSTVAWAENGVRADLHAQVEAVPAAIYGEPRFILRADVLDLIDGGRDD